MRKVLCLGATLGLNAALGLGAALTLAAPAAAEPVGFLATTVGDVRLSAGGAGAWQAAQRDSEVAVGDGVRTGPASQAKIVLVDDTLLQIDEETDLRIETWHVGQAATRDRSILRQTRGRLRATVGDAFGGSTRLEVGIPTAAIGVKGTDFEVRRRATWEACTLSGAIVVTNSHGSASPAPGTCVHAYADKAPGDPFPNPLAPLEVDGTKRGNGVAAGDFAEKIQVDVAADGEEPAFPGSGPGPGPYEGNKNTLDELGPDPSIPTFEPEAGNGDKEG